MKKDKIYKSKKVGAGDAHQSGFDGSGTGFVGFWNSVVGVANLNTRGIPPPNFSVSPKKGQAFFISGRGFIKGAHRNPLGF